MATVNKGGTVTLQELVVSSLAQTDALSKLLIEKGVITQDEFMEKIKAERQCIRRCFAKRLTKTHTHHVDIGSPAVIRLPERFVAHGEPFLGGGYE